MVAAGVLVALAACQEPDPNYGDPNGIIGKKLPGEKAAPAGTDTSSVSAPPTSLATAHATDAAKAKSAPLTDVPDCMACHTGNVGPKFSFGGRVVDGKAGVADVIVNVDGLSSVKTDADGYFWSTEGAVAKGATTSVQKGGTTTPMGQTLGEGVAGGGCLATGSCHGGAQGPIHP